MANLALCNVKPLTVEQLIAKNQNAFFTFMAKNASRRSLF